MQDAFGHWRHVFKLDPERELSDEALDRLCRSGTDAILVGGSSGVTYDNTADLLARIRRHPVICVLEISTDEALVSGFDYYFVPMVLNTPRGEWTTGRQQQALREAGPYLDWSRIAAEGYVIVNEESTAGRVTEASAPQTLEDLLAFAHLADKLLRMPIFYVEYSGVFGNMDWVRKARDILGGARLFYGGGIDSYAKAAEAARCAHTIVVGNAVYYNLPDALATVEAVRSYAG